MVFFGHIGNVGADPLGSVSLLSPGPLMRGLLLCDRNGILCVPSRCGLGGLRVGADATVEVQVQIVRATLAGEEADFARMLWVGLHLRCQWQLS